MDNAKSFGAAFLGDSSGQEIDIDVGSEEPDLRKLIQKTHKSIRLFAREIGDKNRDVQIRANVEEGEITLDKAHSILSDIVSDSKDIGSAQGDLEEKFAVLVGLHVKEVREIQEQLLSSSQNTDSSLVFWGALITNLGMLSAIVLGWRKDFRERTKLTL